MKKSMHSAYNEVILALILCTVSVILPMGKGPQSLANLAMAAYPKKILALETVPSQEMLDKLMPKDLHPHVAQMLLKPVIEYIRDEKFRSPQVKSCKLPQKYKKVDFDNKGHFALLTDKENSVYLVDIIKSMEPSPESDGSIHIIASFHNQKTANLSRNGKFFAGVNIDNVVTVYSAASSEVLSTINNMKFDVQTLDFNKSGSRLFLAGEGNLAVIDIPSGKQKVEYNKISKIWDFSGDENIVCLLKDDGKTMATFDIENNKLLSQRIFDNDTILDLSCFSDGTKCVLLLADASRKKHINIVSTSDLKTLQSFSVSKGLDHISLSPKNLFVFAEISSSISKQYFIRVSDGKIFSSKVLTVPNIAIRPFNADETRAMFLEYPGAYLKLIDLVNGRLVSEYGVYTDLIFNLCFIDNNTFLTYGRDYSPDSETKDCFLNQCTLLSPEVLEQLSNLSLRQSWILRKIYEGIQNNSLFTLNTEMRQIFFAMPEAIRAPFRHFKVAIPLLLEKKVAATENAPTTIPAIVYQEQRIEPEPVQLAAQHVVANVPIISTPVAAIENAPTTQGQGIEPKPVQLAAQPVVANVPIISTTPVAQTASTPTIVQRIAATVRSIWSTVQSWWGGK